MQEQSELWALIDCWDCMLVCVVECCGGMPKFNFHITCQKAAFVWGMKGYY